MSDEYMYVYRIHTFGIFYQIKHIPTFDYTNCQLFSLFFLLHLSAVFSPNCYVNCIAMEGVAKPVILIESSKWNEVWTYHKCHQSNDKMIVLCTIIGFNLTLYCWLENMSKLHEIQSNLDAIYKFNENHSNYWEKRFN